MTRSVEPAEDYGLFGPDSITWRVWSYPTSLTIGFQRAVVIEELDPHLVAAVDRTGGIYARPRTRYDRTLRYFAMVAFADSASISKAADVLVKVHSLAIGTDPITGTRYDANDPDSQLWIQLTGWHSILKAYEVYGPGKLSPEEEAQYWAECRVAAELQTCDPDDIPADRDELRAYYDRIRPQLVGSPLAHKAMDHLLDASVMLPPVPLLLRPASWVVSRVLRAGTIATMPRWMREMGGVRQGRLTDAAVRPVLRTAFWLVQLNTTVELAVLKLLSPATVPVVEPVLRKVPPRTPEVVTPEAARRRNGHDRPRDAHLDLRARQAEKVFGHSEQPSTEGLEESQALLGSLAPAPTASATG